MKPAITFLLSLCFLFSGGHYCLLAQSPQNSTSLTQAKLSNSFEQAGADLHTNSQTILHKAAPSTTDNQIIDAEEIEDDNDESFYSRKYVEITNYFLTLFYNQLSGNVDQHQSNRLPFCKHFSYFSDKYIVHRVIRI